MIGLPFNDHACLGSITEQLAELVEVEAPALVEIAAKHPTTESLAEWIRGLPQRDDEGAKDDGPKVEACEPPQRLRIPAPDPNCVERAALYVAVGEIIDPDPVRQLATLDTPIGMHTFPVENGTPVILDPRVTRNCLACGVALTQEGPVVIETRDAIEWAADRAAEQAGGGRNGPSRVRRARNAVMRLVDEGVAPATEGEVDAIGWMFTLAEQAARRHGARAIAMVRSTALAIADLADEALTRATRNFPLALAGMLLEQPWVSQLATVAGRVGLDVGAVALRSKLDSLGIGGDMVGLVEEELNREGLTLGVLAHPPKLTTFASMQRTA